MKITFTNGDFYEGQVKNNQYHGRGFYSSKANGTY